MPQEQEVAGRGRAGFSRKGAQRDDHDNTQAHRAHRRCGGDGLQPRQGPATLLQRVPRGGRDALTDVTLTPEGVGSTYAWKGSMFVFHTHGVSTREEYIPNERIVDRSSTGPVWTWTFEPDPTGTTLSLAFEWSTKVPLMDKAVDRVRLEGRPGPRHHPGQLEKGDGDLTGATPRDARTCRQGGVD